MAKKKSTSTRRAESEAAMRAAELRKAQEKKDRRRRNAITSVVVLAVIAVVAGVGVAVFASRDSTGSFGATPGKTVGSGGYAVPYGKSSAPVKVVVYEDFLCPFCGQFEQASRQMLKGYVDKGQVQVQYHVLSFLSRLGPYSADAANAYAVVYDAKGQKAAKSFHDTLYENQPAEEGPFPTPDDLVQRAVDAGVPEAQAKKGIDDEVFKSWVANVTDGATKDGVNATPTVLVDGKKLDPNSIQDLVTQVQQRIEAGLKK